MARTSISFLQATTIFKYPGNRLFQLMKKNTRTRIIIIGHKPYPSLFQSLSNTDQETISFSLQSFL